MTEPRHLLEVALEAAAAGAEVLARYFRSGIRTESKDDHDVVSVADRESEAAIVDVLLDRFPDHRILAEEGGYRGAAESRPLAKNDGPSFEWIVDPLDGTKNFLQGHPMFCISIACRLGDKMQAAVVLQPIGGDRFAASRGGGAFHGSRRICVSERRDLEGAFLATGFPFRARAALDPYLGLFREVFLGCQGIRRCGSAALDLAYTAAGIYDGFFEFRLSSWDLAAGALLIEEAGGRVTDLDGGGAYLEGGNVLAGPPGVHRRLLELAGTGRVTEELLDHLVPRIRSTPAPLDGSLA